MPLAVIPKFDLVKCGYFLSLDGATDHSSVDGSSNLTTSQRLGVPLAAPTRNGINSNRKTED